MFAGLITGIYLHKLWCAILRLDQLKHFAVTSIYARQCRVTRELSGTSRKQVCYHQVPSKSRWAARVIVTQLKHVVSGNLRQ